ncbi:MAG: helix-hairpin-helix domain-containing protein [Arenicellales bacterium]|nr:helix-hairpin-helix domain-containing protein [Arenicellales bacterium]
MQTVILPPPTEEAPVIGSVNINTATVDEIDAQTRIGLTFAGRIIDYREEYGLFETVEELLEVRGIGEKTLDGLRDYVILSP